MQPLFPATPLLLAHRGDHRRAAENSLAAYENAIKAGLDGIEFDVHLTLDGVLVCHHDFEIEGRPIAEETFLGLRSLRRDLPTLEETLALFDAYPEAWLNLEIKSRPPETDGRERAIAECLTVWPGKKRVWVSSFDPFALLRFSQAESGIPAGFLIDWGLPPATELAHMGIALHPHELLLTKPERLAPYRRAGVPLVAWTVNDAARARWLLAWGVQVLIGNDPIALLAARGE